MTKKNDKRLCWNCDGAVSLHLGQCPYCGVDLSHPRQEESPPFKGFENPFQTTLSPDETLAKPPYAAVFNQVSEEEWKSSLGEKEEGPLDVEEDISATTKREMIALLLLLPGAVFFLFGLVLFFFSSDGILTLQWNQSFAYFYFFGAVPLLFLGWRALR